MGRSLLLKKPVSMVKMPFVMDSEGGEKFAHGDKRHLKKKRHLRYRIKTIKVNRGSCHALLSLSRDIFCTKQGSLDTYPPLTFNRSPRRWKVLETKSWQSEPDGKVP